MAVHLMVKSEDGKSAGVAVLMQEGKANGAVGRLWAHMPRTESEALPVFSRTTFGRYGRSTGASSRQAGDRKLGKPYAQRHQIEAGQPIQG
jgi:hypothetical protein